MPPVSLHPAVQSLWLSLHFPELALACYTDTTQHPVVLLEKGRVLLCNATARDAGIVCGQSLQTALALQPALKTANYCARREQQQLRQCAQLAYRFTPAVHLRAPRSLLLDIGPSLRYFGGQQALLDALFAQLGTLPTPYMHALADTPEAAWMQSHYPGTLLHDLPLQALSVDTKTHKALQQTGLNTLGDLYALNRVALARRFGKDLLSLLDRIAGTQPDPLPFFTPDTTYSDQCYFLDVVDYTQGLLFAAQRLLQSLQQFLRRHQLQCLGFEWQLLHPRLTPTKVPIQLGRAQLSAEVFLTLSKLAFERLQLRAPVEGLQLHSSQLVAMAVSAQDLFAGEQCPEQRAALIAKLNIRLGANSCRTLVLRDQLAPENLLRWHAADGANNLQTVAIASATAPRPCWLLPTPQPMAKNELQLLQHTERLQLHHPARSDALAVDRDYFIARHHSGALYWVFLCQKRQRWYVHGLFA